MLGPRRCLPGRAGGHSPGSAAPPGHHEVQPGPDLDTGERRRHRRRVHVHLRHGGARRLPVRRPHHPGVEPLPSAATRSRSSRALHGCCVTSTGSASIRSAPRNCSSCAPTWRPAGARWTSPTASSRLRRLPRLPGRERRADRGLPRPAGDGVRRRAAGVGSAPGSSAGRADGRSRLFTWMWHPVHDLDQ